MCPQKKNDTGKGKLKRKTKYLLSVNSNTHSFIVILFDPLHRLNRIERILIFVVRQYLGER